MTKQQLRDEVAPIRGLSRGQSRRKRRRQMQLARARMMAAVPDADVVVTNPTHFAVALSLRRHSARRPRSSPRARIWSPRRSGGSPKSTTCRSSAIRRWRVRCTASTEIGQLIPAGALRGGRASARLRLPHGRAQKRRPRERQQLLKGLLRHTDLLAALSVVLRRHDARRAVAVGAAGPADHDQHLRRAHDRGRDDVPGPAARLRVVPEPAAARRRCSASRSTSS